MRGRGVKWSEATVWHRGVDRQWFGAGRGEREPERRHNERQRRWVELLELEDMKLALWSALLALSAALLTKSSDLPHRLDV